MRDQPCISARLGWFRSSWFQITRTDRPARVERVAVDEVVFRGLSTAWRWAELRFSRRIAGPTIRPATRPRVLSDRSGSCGRRTRNVRPTAGASTLDADHLAERDRTSGRRDDFYGDTFFPNKQKRDERIAHPASTAYGVPRQECPKPSSYLPSRTRLPAAARRSRDCDPMGRRINASA